MIGDTLFGDVLSMLDQSIFATVVTVRTHSWKRAIEQLYVAKTKGNSPALVIAATGVGKSTVLPVRLAETFGDVYVLVDDLVLASSLSSYTHSRYPFAQVKYLLKREFVRDLVLPQSQCLIIDEAHTDDAYTRWLVNDYPLSPGSKFVVACTATPLEPNAVGRTLYDVFDYEVSDCSTSQLLVKVPYWLREGIIRDFTLVLVGGKLEAQKLADHYHNTYGLPTAVVTRGNYHSAREGLTRLQRPVVVFATSAFQTGFTLPADVVIDTGEVLAPVAGVGSAVWKVRSVTLAERNQRRGRVGRTKSGVFVYQKVDLTVTSNDEHYDEAIFQVLRDRPKTLKLSTTLERLGHKPPTFSEFLDKGLHPRTLGIGGVPERSFTYAEAVLTLRRSKACRHSHYPDFVTESRSWVDYTWACPGERVTYPGAKAIKCTKDSEGGDRKSVV